MWSDYETNPKAIKVLITNGIQYIKLEDIISWLKENRPNADTIETDWLIKVFVRLKNSTK